MEKLEVRIVQLEPLRVASFLGFGASPEYEALDAMGVWAEARGLQVGKGRTRLFGFNNPNPSHGSPNYGYEVWLTVGEDITGGDGATIKVFAGGLYAVTRSIGVENIQETWQRLALWRENGRFLAAEHQWLEEHLSPAGTPLEQFMLDLYLPIAE